MYILYNIYIYYTYMYSKHVPTFLVKPTISHLRGAAVSGSAHRLGCLRRQFGPSLPSQAWRVYAGAGEGWQPGWEIRWNSRTSHGGVDGKSWENIGKYGEKHVHGGFHGKIIEVNGDKWKFIQPYWSTRGLKQTQKNPAKNSQWHKFQQRGQDIYGSFPCSLCSWDARVGCHWITFRRVAFVRWSFLQQPREVNSEPILHVSWFRGARCASLESSPATQLVMFAIPIGKGKGFTKRLIWWAYSQPTFEVESALNVALTNL